MNPVVALEQIDAENYRNSDPLSLNHLIIENSFSIEKSSADCHIEEYLAWDTDELAEEIIVKNEASYPMPVVLESEINPLAFDEKPPPDELMLTEQELEGENLIEADLLSDTTLDVYLKEMSPDIGMDNLSELFETNSENIIEPDVSIDQVSTETLEAEVIFQCDLCAYKTKLKQGIQAHMRKHMKAPGSHRCPFCEETFLRTQNVATHVRACHLTDPNNLNCHCGLLFSCFRELESHMIAAHNQKTHIHSCSLCQKPLKHCRSIHNCAGDTRSLCKICGKRFESEIIFRDHVKRHKNAVKCKHPGCDKKFTNSKNASYHYETKHLPPKIVTCPICSLTFKADICLQYHFDRNHRVERVKCMLLDCNYMALRRPHLILHYDKHIREDESLRQQLEKHAKEVKFLTIVKSKKTKGGKKAILSSDEKEEKN